MKEAIIDPKLPSIPDSVMNGAEIRQISAEVG
jgi:hypothetical protein